MQRLEPERGVPAEVVTTLYQDRDGFIWIGSRSGLALYDGETFTLFEHDIADPSSLSDNAVRTVYEDSWGQLWVGTNTGGLNRLDRSTWKFEHFRHDSSDPSTISHDSVYAILDDRRGNLWVATQQGLNRMDRQSGTFQRFLGPDSERPAYVTSLLQDHRGRLLAGTVQGGVLVLKPGAAKLAPLALADETSGLLDGAIVFDLYEDEEKRLLITVDYGLLIVEPDGTASYAEGIGAAPDRPGTATVTSLAPAPDGTVWAGTHGAGLVLFDPVSHRMHRLRYDPARSRSLSHDTVIDLMTDRQGTLWIATWGGGVSRITRSAMLLAAASPPPPPPPSVVTDYDVTSLYDDRSGKLLIGTRSGALLRFDPDRNRNEVILDSRGRSALSLSEDADGNLWVGTSNELIRIDSGSGSIDIHEHDSDDPNSPGPGYVRALLHDRAGRFWVGTGEGGLQQVDPAARVVRSFRHDPADQETLSDDYVTALLEDRRGTLWIGTRSGGLNALDPETGRVRRFPSGPPGSGRLSHHQVTSLAEGHDGSIWVGTGGGLNRLQRHDDGSFNISSFSEAEGLIDDNVMALVLDDDGSLWASTKLGLSRRDPFTGTFINYYKEDGLPSTEFEPGAAARFERSIYFGTVRWIAAAPAGTPLTRLPPSRTVVRDIRLPGHGRMEGGPAWRVDRLTIPYGQWFSLDLATLDRVGGPSPDYSYRLGGGETEWIDLGTQHSVTFTDLRPGRYLFEARGYDGQSAWSYIEPPITITIVPPFWMTAWFRGLILVLVVAGALSVHFGRMAAVNRRNRELERLHQQREQAEEERETALRRLRALARSLERAKEDERKHVARELHDDLGPALTAVLINLQLVGREPLSGQSSRRIAETTDLVDRLVARIRDLSLDLRPPLLDDLGLIASLKGYMETQMERTGQRILVRDQEMPEHLSPEVEITGFRIAQEAVTNAIRHASADTVTVTVTGRNGSLDLQVEDDGCGFEVSDVLQMTPTGKALGLLGMQERVRMLGGACVIDSSPGRGTRVQVRLPLEPA